MANHKIPVEWRGRKFESLRDMSRQLGVSEGQISKMRAKGRLDDIEPLKDGETSRDRAYGVTRQPLTSHGFKWVSHSSFAEEFNVTSGYVTKLLEEGRIDRFVARRKGIKS